MRTSKVLALACLAVGVLFYVVAIAGLLWPATKPTDVGLLSTSGVLVLFGLAGLALREPPVRA